MLMAESDFDRGRKAGTQEEQMVQYAANFKRINGSIDAVNGNLVAIRAELHSTMTGLTLRLGDLAMEIQRLADLGDSREKTVKETAAALKVADDQRRDASDTRSKPVTQTIAVVMAVIGVLGILIAAYVASQN